MKKLSIPVYLMPGNRDFMMGKSFAAECGATLFSDPHVIDLYGVPTLLSHGDILCANDYFQRIFRYCTKGALVRNLFLKFSLKFRMRLVNFIRKFSVYNNQRKSVQLMDVNQKTTCSMMQRYNAKLIIHGHTHKPGISRVKGNDNLTRISLPNWTEKKGEALKYYADGTYKFVEIR
jgi:UDP-2,3-diacylglucosamine hydrolase